MSDLFTNFNLYSDIYNPYGSQSNSSNSIPLDNPDETVVYFEERFSGILDNLLFNTNNSDDSGDFFGNTESSSLDSITKFYTEQIELLEQQNSNTDLNKLNDYAALIGKQATYVYDGHVLKGQIESVVIDNGTSYLKIDGNIVDVANIAEVYEA